MKIICKLLSADIHFINNNNNPFNGPLSRMTRVSQYQKNIYLYAVFVTIIQQTPLINFLHFVIYSVWSGRTWKSGSNVLH